MMASPSTDAAQAAAGTPTTTPAPAIPTEPLPQDDALEAVRLPAFLFPQ